MVHPTSSSCEPQFYTINNIQDAFDLLSRGFEVYNQTTAPKSAKHTAKEGAQAETSSNGAGQKRRSYQPDLDITESSDTVVIEVSLPGVDKSAIGIEYDAKENNVVLTGDFKKTERAQDVKLIRHERPVGKYERIVSLGQHVIVADHITAQYTDGVLTVTVPKNKEVELKKKIAVQ